MNKRHLKQALYGRHSRAGKSTASLGFLDKAPVASVWVTEYLCGKGWAVWFACGLQERNTAWQRRLNWRER